MPTQPLSHSVTSGKPRIAGDTDDRVHEYEQQVAALYEELEQEKQRTAMLDECLQEQKSEKHKYMKACKRLKQELQVVRDSGLNQMLADMESKCALLEQEKQCLTESLQQEQATVNNLTDFVPAPGLTKKKLTSSFAFQVRQQEEENDELQETIERVRHQLAQSQGNLFWVANYYCGIFV